MLPIFLIDSPNEEQEISSMPGVKRMGVNAMVKFLEPLVKIGLKSVLLFSVTSMTKVRWQ
jgi:porphobilinogen synthase